MSPEPENPYQAKAGMGDCVKVSVARGPQPEEPEAKPKEKEEEAPDESKQVDS